MSEQSAKNQYMLIFRNTEWCKGLSPEEIQKVTGAWMSWFERLSLEGKVLAGNPLEVEGKIVSSKNGKIVADGPFAESKEAIGGYFLLQVNSFEEAMAIAKECPGLPYGSKVEVRAIADQCPMQKQLEAELAQSGRA